MTKKAAKKTHPVQRKEPIPPESSEESGQPAAADTPFGDNPTIHTLLESLAEGVVIIDATASILMINRRSEQLFGYSREELVGRPLNTLLPARFHAPHQDHVKDYFDHPRVRPMGEGRSLVGHSKDGREFPVEISLSHLETQGKRLAIAFITDISQRVTAEEDLKRRNEELDAFAHTVAHDLKGSLTALIGHSELLSHMGEKLDASIVRESLEQIHDSSRKMTVIIDELLLLASVGKDEVEVAPLNMRLIVGEAAMRLHHECEERGGQISVTDDFPPALGYAPWVEEVWYNYINNALRHGGTPPHIKIGGGLTQSGMAEFWVEDKGPGLTEEEQSALFTPHARHSVKPGNHGLGLSIVKRIVEKLDGEVKVRSTVGAGSRFSFTLPAPKSR